MKINEIWTIGPRSREKFKKESSGRVKILAHQNDLVRVQDIRTGEETVLLCYALGTKDILSPGRTGKSGR